MLADQIIKGAKIFTSDKENPLATCLAVKDGTFVYVGDEAGLSDLEGEVHDLGGKFIMPGIIDSHVHVTMGCGYEFADMGEIILGCDSKDEAMDYIRAYVKDHPGRDRYRLILDKKYLHGASITKEDLDVRRCAMNSACTASSLQPTQGGSRWPASRLSLRRPEGMGLASALPSQGRVYGVLLAL